MGMGLTFAIEIEREDDGRWIAEIPDLPGVMAYGATEQAAIAAVEVLALRVLADRLEQGEAQVSLSITFAPAAA
jgi:predicted RNase H-like HicB family nuclease